MTDKNFTLDDLDKLLDAVDKHIEEQECLFIKYINSNPEDKDKPLFISCPCPKCTVSF